MDVDLPLIDGLRMNKKRREAESGELGPAGEDTGADRIPISTGIVRLQTCYHSSYS
jgi:hypothetical protein